MSGEKTASPCNKFQANIFNKSKCQNCFKSRELHLLSDHDMDQAKPIYGGWLCLAPEGTHFDNPMQRSRKWQRRFFILYEHGSLSFALDELPSTLPQGTVNMNLCTEVADAEPRTGQRNALVLVTPEQEFFIRGENKEIINGWSEQLTVYPLTNKQNQKKKRKVEPTSIQEPSPAKIAATEPGSPATGGPAEPGLGLWQEEQPGGGPEGDRVRTATDTDPLDPHETPADDVSHYLPTAPRERSSFDGSLLSCSSCLSTSLSSLNSEASGSSDSEMERHPAPSNSHAAPTTNKPTTDRGLEEASRSCYKGTVAPNVVHSGRTEAGQKADQVLLRTGRAEGRSGQREKLQSCGDIAQLTVTPPQRRARSLDRRTTESIMTPDLLNFKKGWMVKLDNKDEWTKYWFVLSADSLRYYKDSIAEEASDLQGEIDLTKCYNVSEYQVQRNYGFQIHTQKCVYTLTAMTAGIRRNWIQALMKNVRPSNAPDVASLPGHIISCSPPEPLPKPDVTQDSSSEAPSQTDRGPKPSRARERRRQGRYKTFDWAEFRPLAKLAPEPDAGSTREPLQFDGERKTRREERRKRHEGVLGFPLGLEDVGGHGSAATSPRTKRRMQEETEQCWLQVERTVLDLDRMVPLCSEAQAKQTAELERLLEDYRKGVEDLKSQLAESDHQRRELETQLSAAQDPRQQVLTSPLPLLIDPILTPESDSGPLRTKPLTSHSQSLRDLYRETQELLQQQDMIRQSMQEQLGLSVRRVLPCPETQPPSIWLRDPDGNLQELEDLFPGGPMPSNTPAPTPVSGSPPLPSEGGGGRPDLADEPVLTAETLARGPEPHNDPSVWCPGALAAEDSVESSDILGTDGRTCWGADGQGPERVDPGQITAGRLSDEIVLLTGQNEALERLNQEMLNQLKEADREIDRLKAELLSRPSELRPQPQGEGLERELGRRTQELGESRALLASMDRRLADTEARLRLKEDALQVLGRPETGAETEEVQDEAVYRSHFGEKGEGLHRGRLEVTEAERSERGRQLGDTEQTCPELQAQNTELRPSEGIPTQTEAETEAKTLNNDLDSVKNTLHGDTLVSSDERIQEVAKGITMRSKVVGKALEVIGRSALKVIEKPIQRELQEGEPRVGRHLRQEEEFWAAMRSSLKTDPSRVDEEELLESILGEVLEHMVVEKQMLLLAHSLPSEREQSTETGRGSQETSCGSRFLKDLDIIGNIAGETESETTEGHVEIAEEEYVNEWLLHLNAIQRDTDQVDIRHFTEITQEKLSLLNQVAYHVGTAAPDEIHSMACRLWDFHSPRHPWLVSVHCAAVEVFSYYQTHLLLDQQQRALDSQPARHTAPVTCSSCAGLTAENQELRARLSDLEGLSAGTQEESAELDSLSVGIPPLNNTEESEVQEKKVGETDEGISAVPPGNEAEISGKDEAFWLRGRVKDLEEQLSTSWEQLAAEYDGRMASLQQQHEKDLGKLKATYEGGFVSLEESHQKVLVELQHRHQHDLQRLLRDKDRLLEEETAATAIAIQAIQKAHCLELERELQKLCQTSTGNADLEEICRQHSEELASCQRELEVLSQQFSLKCLENGHFAQALEAERQALCQCQQENQDLRSRNQELTGHLAAEITRLCSLAKQDAIPLRQGIDVFELEITLRVKESEVQCLRQEITSIKDELQTTQRDKRFATQKYKDIYTELSIVRAKAERDSNQLRENLNLAHKALGKHSPRNTNNGIIV